MTIEFKGAGVEGVFLLNGYRSEIEHGESATSYEDLEGLYLEIGRAIALSDHQLTAGEIKFIRKRLGMNQEEFGRVVGKTNQAVAKWEKNEAAVPVGDGKFMRLAWLAKFDPAQLAEATRQLIRCDSAARPAKYVFEFDGLRWEPVVGLTTPAWSQAESASAIATAITSSKKTLAEPVEADRIQWTAQR